MHHCSHLTVFCVFIGNDWYKAPHRVLINMCVFVCSPMCFSDEEKSSSEKYSVVECVDSETTVTNSSVMTCCPKTGSDTTHTYLTLNYINFNTCTLFALAFTLLWTLPSVSVSDLINSFSSTVITVMDAIVLITTKVIPGKKKWPRIAQLAKPYKRVYATHANPRWLRTKLISLWHLYRHL